MIRHIVFDIGWVFVDLDYEGLLRLLRREPSAPIDMGAVAAGIGLEDHESGRIDGEQLVANIVRLSGDRATADEARSAWLGMFTLQPRMVDLAQRLAGRYRVHLLSNVGDLHWDHLSRAFGIDRIGHGALTSFAAGVMKPDERIYLEAERRFGLAPAATVFIDDRAENIAAAKARGWQGIVHRSHDPTLEALAALGVITH